jgi:hypothetical protein
MRVQDPEFRALVTTMVLDRVGGTAEADVHTPPMPVPAEDDLVEQSAESRDWLLR